MSKFKYIVTFTPADSRAEPYEYLATSKDDASFLCLLAGDATRAGGKFTYAELPEPTLDTPGSGLVNVRFNRIVLASNRDCDVFLARYFMPVVPRVGDTVCVDGHPFIVYEDGWAVCEDGTFAYLRVVPASPFPETTK